MRLWKKKDPVQDNAFRQGPGPPPGNPAMPHRNPAMPHGNPAMPHGGPAMPHRNPAMPHGGGDPSLPGSAGYRQGPTTTLSRFNFVRPDGRVDPRQRRR